MKILLVGAGGYASGYVKTLLSSTLENVVWEGVVDPYFDLSKDKEAILAAGIPVYSSMEAFYSERTADLAVICTPTYLHKQHSICALEHGSYVLCEKPVAPIVADAKAMMEAERKHGKWIAIGYQWSYSDAILELKKDIMNGLLGKPLFFKTAISWPRNKAYYARGSGWAGKIKKEGTLLLDSVASNACAHYIHNMLFILGEKLDESTSISSFEAECYRANDIENFDTCSIKMLTDNSAQLYFIASHATEKKKDPEFVYTFENATVTYSRAPGAVICAKFNDGHEKIYGDPFNNDFKKLSDCISCVENGTLPICTAKTATAHTKLIEDIYRNVNIKDFPKESIVFDEVKNAVHVEGLFELIYKAYEKTAMLSEINDIF